MNRQERLARKVDQIQKDLNRWVKKRGGLKEGENLLVSVLVSVQVLPGTDIRRMRPDDFFTYDRLKATGLSPWLVTRAYNGLRNVLTRRVGKRGPNGWEGVPKEVDAYGTMEEFSIAYHDASKLFKIKNLGKSSIVGIVKAMRDAGFQVKDVQNMLG